MAEEQKEEPKEEKLTTMGRLLLDPRLAEFVQRIVREELAEQNRQKD